MSGTETDLLWEVLGGAVLLLSLLLIARSLFADRSRGRRRCPSCWYDMAGVTTLCCPECGKSARSERHLFRTRRRWRWAAAGLTLGLLGIGVPATLLGVLNAWRFAPGWVLVFVGKAGSTYDPSPRPVDLELRRRMNADELSDAQWSVLFGRSLRSSNTYARHLLYTRATSPVGFPIVVGGVADPQSLFYGCPALEHQLWLECRLLTTPDGVPAKWVTWDEHILFSPKPLGIPKPNVNAVDVEVKVCAAPSRVLWRGVQTLPIHVAGTPDEVLKPVSSPKIDAGVLAFLNPAIHFSSAPWEPRGSVVVPTRTVREQFLGRYIAIGVNVRVLRDGREVYRTKFSDEPPLTGGHCGNEPTTRQIDRGWAEDDTPEQILASTWEIEFTGDQTLAFNDYDWWGTQEHRLGAQDRPSWQDPDEYWSGSFRITVRPRVGVQP